nr:hypothetical protein [uncultured Rhodopila sp.]
MSSLVTISPFWPSNRVAQTEQTSSPCSQNAPQVRHSRRCVRRSSSPPGGAWNEAGRRNPVSVTRIEAKMGLHASPTCHLVSDNVPAEVVEAEGDPRMFSCN